MIKLVKTTGGTHGSPIECGSCNSKHFAKSGIAWHCTACGSYHPTAIGFETIKESVEQANSLMKRFNGAINDLAKIIKK